MICQIFYVSGIIWYFLLRFSAAQTGKSVHSSLTLYQGEVKHELDGKDCPVGVAFSKPERFSCACINGIWAFYDNPCQAPVAVVGGNNHCFPMPLNPISLAVVVGNPLRGLGETISVFESDMESIHTKVYRNTHLTMNNADQFVTLNSSWTLSSPDGSRSICLDSGNGIVEGQNVSDANSAPELTYCSFVGVSKEIPFIGSVKKGCNGSMVLEPIKCQPILPTTGEEVCLRSEVLTAYQHSIQIDLDPVTANQWNDNEDTLQWRLSRALKNLGTFDSSTTTTTTTTTSTTTTTTTTTEKYGSTYENEPSWHKRWAASKDPKYFEESTKSSGQSGRSLSSNTKDIKIKMNKPPPISLDEAWNNPKAFLAVPPSASNQLVTNHVWMYQRIAIRNSLNITRMVPPDVAMGFQIDTGKVKKLLGVHADIMKKICKVVPSSFFDTLSGTFLSLLTKAFRWKEPYVEQANYLRILTSLTICRDNANALQFKTDLPCNQKGSDYILLPDKGGEGAVSVKLESLPIFKSEMFEPTIEAAWKTFVSVHSYCFKDFSDRYQDHHKYTTLMMGLFTNQLHDIWVRNKTIAVEYSGVLGEISETMLELERCTMGARMTSEYPFHMSRPTKLVRFKESNSAPLLKSRRKRSSVHYLNTDTTANSNSLPIQDVPHSRKKRVIFESTGETILNYTIFNGHGFCLKKYTDVRISAGRDCKKGKLADAPPVTN